MRHLIVDNVYNIVYLVDIVNREDRMNTQPRKIRQDLTKEQRERLERFGSIEFKSTRSPDMRVEPFVPSREQH